jgi:hypothetical protein
VFLEAHSWSEEQHNKLGGAAESAVRSPWNFSGSVLPSVFLIACLISTVRLYVVC